MTTHGAPGRRRRHVHSPRIRRAAAHHGLDLGDLGAVTPTGHHGRLTAADVARAAQQPATTPHPGGPAGFAALEIAFPPDVGARALLDTARAVVAAASTVPVRVEPAGAGLWFEAPALDAATAAVVTVGTPVDRVVVVRDRDGQPGMAVRPVAVVTVSHDSRRLTRAAAISLLAAVATAHGAPGG